MPPIVLASTSAYRRELLARLQVPFSVAAPDIDERAAVDETPLETACRLALAKAQAISARFPEAIVIGSDQVADVDGEPLSKPGTHDAALVQLERMQGRTIVFHTALAVICRTPSRLEIDSVPTTVKFRDLPRHALETYLRAEAPYDCAGAAKIESLGIVLVESVRSDDPTALVGLPLIRLTSMLAACGVPLPLR